MLVYYKHYARTDSKKNVIKIFSDGFETPIETDVCINDTAGRICEIRYLDKDGKPLFKLVGTELISIKK